MNLKRIAALGGGYPFSVACVLVATLLILPFRPVLSSATVMLLYVPVIILVARLAGAWPSATAALLAFLALDLVFVPPYYRLRVASVSEWLGLIVFLIVALVAGQQTGRLRVRERDALQRQRELELLNTLSFRIAAEKSTRSTAEFIADEVTEVLGAQRAALYVPAGGTGTPTCLAEAGDPKASSGEAALVAWVLRTGKAVDASGSTGARAGGWPAAVGPRDAIAGVIADGDYLPLLTSDSLEGVLYARSGDGLSSPGPDPHLLAAIANLAAASLERQRLEDEAARAAALAETDRMKTTLVSSLSHELKTPLAAATARVTGLIDEGASVDASRVHSELTAVSEDLGRLDASIGDLLDLSRLESDAWRPHFELQDISDVLGTVRSRLSRDDRLRVAFSLPEDLPPVCCDFAQLARAFANLVENALAYSPADSPVIVGAEQREDTLLVYVEDRGTGVPDQEKGSIFDKFYRGEASVSAPAGTGLGLAIAREIVRTHGARLWVEDAAPSGARFVVSLPLAECPNGA
jgi:two-component system sensor histidine kinase KdpD